ncbi:MAG: thioredoxin family protein [Desulfuromonas sp.]|nr:MAG: thioredoxin family protein [Desulfuromonas sp.]
MRIDIICRPDSNQKCYLALNNVRTALEALSIEAEVHLYRDRKKMIDNRVYVTPAVLIDDDLRISGRVPEVVEICEMIRARPHYRQRLKDVA